MSEPGTAIRYLRLRADTLMGMFRLLPAPARALALAALARSTFEHGGDSARRYFEAEPDVTALLERIETTAGELGWGKWSFVRRDSTRLVLEVEDSPFAAGYGRADSEVCAPISGMLEAVATLVFGVPCDAREVACSACAGGRCRFEAIARNTP